MILRPVHTAVCATCALSQKPWHKQRLAVHTQVCATCARCKTTCTHTPNPRGCAACALSFPTVCITGNTTLSPFQIHPIVHFIEPLFILFRRNQPHPYEFLPRPFEGHVVALAFLMSITKLVVDFHLVDAAFIWLAAK